MKKVGEQILFDYGAKALGKVVVQTKTKWKVKTPEKKIVEVTMIIDPPATPRVRVCSAEYTENSFKRLGIRWIVRVQLEKQLGMRGIILKR